MKARHQINDFFLLQNIAVTSNTLFCSQIAAILALTLIKSAFEGAIEPFLLPPNDFKDWIKSLCQYTGLNLEINPIDKIAIEPTGPGVELSFVELIESQDDGQGANQTSRQFSSRNNYVMVSQKSVII